MNNIFDSLNPDYKAKTAKEFLYEVEGNLVTSKRYLSEMYELHNRILLPAWVTKRIDELSTVYSDLNEEFKQLKGTRKTLNIEENSILLNKTETLWDNICELFNSRRSWLKK
jgi:hypothetical protein